MSDGSIVAKLTFQGMKGAVVKDGVFKTCTTAPSYLAIPYGVTRLRKGCLSGQNELETIRLPEGVVIEDCVLANCINLKYIKCPETLKCYEHNLKYGNNAEIIYAGVDING
jgi:hypothetical protein